MTAIENDKTYQAKAAETSFGHVQAFLFLPSHKVSSVTVSHGLPATLCRASWFKCTGVSNGLVRLKGAWGHTQDVHKGTKEAPVFPVSVTLA